MENIVFYLKFVRKKNIPFNIGMFNFVNSNNKSDSEVNFGRELTHDCQSQKMYLQEQHDI